MIKGGRSLKGIQGKGFRGGDLGEGIKGRGFRGGGRSGRRSKKGRPNNARR